jgi:hypothetical protein
MDRTSVCSTAIGALERSQILMKDCLDFAKPVDSIQLNLHFLGAEELECKNSMSSDEFILSYAKLLEGAEQLGIRDLRITFIGPNILGNDSQNIFFYHSMRVSVESYACLYHDYYRARKEIRKFETPDMILMLNAGIWGYTSWLPTLDVFAQISIYCESSSSSCEYYDHEHSSAVHVDTKSSMSAPIFIVTSYTIEEAEDDEDTIREHFRKKLILPVDDQQLLKDREVLIPFNHTNRTSDYQGALQPHWIWESEISPFRGLEEVERLTKLDGREYRLNHAWQCFTFSVTKP